MRKALAERLLAKILNWNPSVISSERPIIQAMSSFKFDEYQQFSTGTLFIESLVKWLSQFEEEEERQTAYDFVKSKLLFLSNRQVLSLVEVTYDTVIRPILIKKTAKELSISEYEIRKIFNSDEYNHQKRKCLYIGLSDGAKIDQLRRSAGLNNEQVVPTYEISKDKTDDLLSELKKANGDKHFNTIFLIDDFTASGTSYSRKDGDERKGKIPKIIQKIIDANSELYPLIDHDERVDIHIIFYIATSEAIAKIEEFINAGVFKQSPYSKIDINIHVVQYIASDTKDKIINEELQFVELSKKYIHSDIVDDHWRKAKHDEYYLGYNECCLPIVLAHNTPNNSLPLLWWTSDDHDFNGLFPRITRHS